MSRRPADPSVRPAGLALPGLVAGILRAAVELARVRLLLRRMTVPQMLASLPVKDAAHDPAQAERVAWLVPRVAARLPFRADCLVQALAARRWLARAGVATELTIGTRKDPVTGFVAHAWLRYGDMTVTGGDFSAYVPLVSSPEASGTRPDPKQERGAGTRLPAGGEQAERRM